MTWGTPGSTGVTGRPWHFVEIKDPCSVLVRDEYSVYLIHIKSTKQSYYSFDYYHYNAVVTFTLYWTNLIITFTVNIEVQGKDMFAAVSLFARH